ncbi:RagB/SusD family nutrient uptake outer membrane protein [Flavivirga eckloniae]|uniref:Uncharacterized protein n=1 Tax=Flavivirga eckloniae TaxID=1803846 RepID=A0A2K9PSC4_9FLAO|nr:RagB/SusD family nutrient uptake outer membrane protein [Flavivirga eckloniae]AUP79960.1 hypothetical protein C1H87_15120 [Flavivirga eckloniae]
MKNIKYIALTVICFVAITACDREEYLDIQPKNVIVPETLADFRLLLDNTALSFFDGGLVDGFQKTHTISQFFSDDIRLSPALAAAFFNQDTDIRAYLFDPTIYNASQDDTDFNAYYSQIYAANVILDGLESAEGSMSEKNVLEAEAKLHRAYAYFNLVNLYATHYNSATASSDLGVPIREGVALTGLDLIRASVQEVYDLVLSEIQFGIQILPDTQPQDLIFRPSKAAAYGLLAKVYLYQGHYEEALVAVNNALSLKNDLRDINTDETSFSDPSLRVVPFVLDNPQVVWYKTVGFFLQNAPTDALINLYEDGDVRRQWYADLRPNIADLDGVYYGARYFQGGASGLNTPELYLIQAEVNARLGNIQSANDALNTLRSNRFTPETYTPISITDQTELLQFVKEERRRESGGSIDRLFDIKRYNLLDNDNISVTHTFGDQTVTLPPNSQNFVLPIGLKYIQINPEIIQNPRD